MSLWMFVTRMYCQGTAYVTPIGTLLYMLIYYTLLGCTYSILSTSLYIRMFMLSWTLLLLSVPSLYMCFIKVFVPDICSFLMVRLAGLKGGRYLAEYLHALGELHPCVSLIAVGLPPATSLYVVVGGQIREGAEASGYASSERVARYGVLTLVADVGQ